MHQGMVQGPEMEQSSLPPVMERGKEDQSVEGLGKNSQVKSLDPGLEIVPLEVNLMNYQQEETYYSLQEKIAEL